MRIALWELKANFEFAKEELITGIRESKDLTDVEKIIEIDRYNLLPVKDYCTQLFKCWYDDFKKQASEKLFLIIDEMIWKSCDCDYPRRGSTESIADILECIEENIAYEYCQEHNLDRIDSIPDDYEVVVLKGRGDGKHEFKKSWKEIKDALVKWCWDNNATKFVYDW